jgi:hypothetical protein
MLRDALRRDDAGRERERRPHHHHHSRSFSRRRSSNSPPRSSKSSVLSPSPQDFDNCNDPSLLHAPLSSSSSSSYFPSPHLVRNKSTSHVNPLASSSTSPSPTFDKTPANQSSARRHTSPSPPAPRPRHLRAFSHTHITSPNKPTTPSNTVPSSPSQPPPPIPTSGQSQGALSPLYAADRDPFSSSPTAFTTPHEHVLRMRLKRVLRRGEQEQEQERERERELARRRQRPPPALRSSSRCRHEEEPNPRWKWAGEEHVDGDLVQTCLPASRSCSSLSASDHEHEFEHDRESECGRHGAPAGSPLTPPLTTPPSDGTCFGGPNGNELLSRTIAAAAATTGAHFNVRQASDMCRKMEGYVSFSSVQGLGEPQGADDDGGTCLF